MFIMCDYDDYYTPFQFQQPRWPRRRELEAARDEQDVSLAVLLYGGVGGLSAGQHMALAHAVAQTEVRAHGWGISEVAAQKKPRPHGAQARVRGSGLGFGGWLSAIPAALFIRP